MNEGQPRRRAARRRRRNNLSVTFVVLLALTMLLVFVNLGKAFARGAGRPQESAAEEPALSPEEEAEEAAKAANAVALSWRDADFAVDPNRTDWNYEDDGSKVVYLTIDDGPSEKTQQVLDILDRYDVKATFFVVGQNPEYYYLIKEAYDRGHTIGLHTYTHDYATVYSSVDAYFADLDQIGQVVKEQIGYVPCFIRFPGGSSNEISADYCTGIMSTLVDAVQERGYQYYDWNASTGDGEEHTTDEIVEFGTTDYGLNNIVLLCHDSATKQTTVDALPSIIEYYQAQGYTFKALDRSSCVIQHGVNN